MDAAVAEIGHNNPPTPTLLERLSEDHAQLRHELETIADQANSGPRKIKTAEDLDAVGKLVTSARALAKKVDATREREKAPYLQAGRDVDTFFKAMLDRLKRIGDAFQGVADDYQRAVAAEARRKAEEEARRAREEEAARIAAARKAEDDNRARHAEQHTQRAEQAAQTAERAEEIASASAADLTRTRTDSGILATAKTEWAFEVEDYDAIPLDKLRMCFKRDDVEKAIRQAVRNGIRSIPGVRIFEKVSAQFR